MLVSLTKSRVEDFSRRVEDFSRRVEDFSRRVEDFGRRVEDFGLRAVFVLMGYGSTDRSGSQMTW